MVCRKQSEATAFVYLKKSCKHCVSFCMVKDSGCILSPSRMSTRRILGKEVVELQVREEKKTEDWIIEYVDSSDGKFEGRNEKKQSGYNGNIRNGVGIEC